MNKVILIGRATRDWELKYTPSGTGVAVTTMAIDRPVAQGKEKEADFISLVAWKQLAETCANYIRKGHKFAAEGRIQSRNYEGNDGKKVYVTEVVVDRVEFLEPKSESQQSKREAPPVDDKPIDISDDDLPF